MLQSEEVLNHMSSRPVVCFYRAYSTITAPTSGFWNPVTKTGINLLDFLEFNCRHDKFLVAIARVDNLRVGFSVSICRNRSTDIYIVAKLKSRNISYGGFRIRDFDVEDRAGISMASCWANGRRIPRQHTYFPAKSIIAVSLRKSEPRIPSCTMGKLSGTICRFTGCSMKEIVMDPSVSIFPSVMSLR